MLKIVNHDCLIGETMNCDKCKKEVKETFLHSWFNDWEHYWDLLHLCKDCKKKCEEMEKNKYDTKIKN